MKIKIVKDLDRYFFDGKGGELEAAEIVVVHGIEEIHILAEDCEIIVEPAEREKELLEALTRLYGFQRATFDEDFQNAIIHAGAIIQKYSKP